MHSKNIFKFFMILILSSSFPVAADSYAGRWQDIGISLSGLAKMQTPRNNATMSFVGVVDSKNSGETRVVIINLDEHYRASRINASWPGEQPRDIESVAAIPNGNTGTNQQFVAADSDGNFWRFTINSNGDVDNVLEGQKTLAQEGSTSSAEEIESVGFFINQNSQKIKWVWAGRGSRDHSAYLFSADFHSSSNSIDYSDTHDFQIQETNFSWLRPTWSSDGDSRLISDLKVADDGAIYTSSAFDGGNNGPFSSVLYNLGVFEKSSEIDFSQTPFQPRTPTFAKGVGKKVEALEFLNGINADDGFLLGSDDENLGGFVLVWTSSHN